MDLDAALTLLNAFFLYVFCQMTGLRHRPLTP